MRDLLFTILLPFFILYAVRSPIVGLFLWFWTSMYPMVNWLYGFALSFRVNLVFAALTMFAYFFRLKNKPEFNATVLFVLVILFFLHSFWGVLLYSNFSYSWTKFFDFGKIVLFFIFATLLLREKNHFIGILTFLILAIGFHGAIEGLKVLATGGGHIVWGIYGPLGDNNKVALGLNMCIPLTLYLASQSKEKLMQWAFYGIAFLCICTILGSRSRGGFLALLAMGAYYWWISHNKFRNLLLVVIIVVFFYNFLPPEWFNRVGAVGDVEETGVLTSRVTTWKINFLAALDYPITGLGFDNTARGFIWTQYVDRLDSLNFIIDTPAPTKGFVAHSIYFEVMGNQGLIGFLLFASILASAFFSLGRSIKAFAKDSWQQSLGKACRISLATYCIGGAALNAAYFELFYLLLAITICLKHIRPQPPKLFSYAS